MLNGAAAWPAAARAQQSGRMRGLTISLAFGVLWTTCATAETLKIASPQPGSWESAIPVLGQQQGFFRQQNLELEIVNTSGSGETLQAVIAGAVDMGLSAGTVGVLGAHARGAPVRIIGASETGSADTFWYVAAKSPIRAMREAGNATLAYSTTGASSHIAVLKFISEYGLNAKPVATGNPAATLTQVMTGQIDVGWAVAPFGLDALERGEIRLVGRASDIAAIREQTIRVQVTNTRTLADKKEPLQRFRNGYRATLDWMYASPEAVPRYTAYSGFSENAVRRMLREFIPKESLQTDEIAGVKESMDDAIQFKFIGAPLTAQQITALIQIPRP
jgi:NitT/TauT family transport system substrate-binding protein